MSVSSEAPTPQVNRAGRAALVAGIIIVVLQLANSITAQLAPLIQLRLGLSVSSIPLLFLPFQLAIGILAVAALILGIIGLNRPGLPRAAAAAGTALGASALFLLIANLAASGIYRIAL